MAAIGTNTVNSISHRYLFPFLVDQIYRSNPVYYRLNASNRVVVQGGYQIELPLLYQKGTGQGWYSGYDLLDTTPDDNVKNGQWDWKQAAKTVTVDGLTQIKTDHPQAIANYIRLKFAEAQMWMEDFLGIGLWALGTETTKTMDGLKGAVDDGTVRAVYAGITRSTDTWWQAQLDTTTATLTLATLRSIFGRATEGSRHPTIIISTQANYDRYWALVQGVQRFPSAPTGTDEQLAKAGFTNLLFDGVPWLVDSHAPTGEGSGGAGTSSVYMLNESYLSLVVAARTSAGNKGFLLKDFQEPANQDAMTAKLLWAGNLVCQNVKRQAKMTNLAA